MSNDLVPKYLLEKMVEWKRAAYGRIGPLHPMFGKHHTTESKDKISAGLLLAREEGRR